MCILLAGEDLLLDELIDSPDLHGSVYKKKKIAFIFITVNAVFTFAVLVREIASV